MKSYEQYLRESAVAPAVIDAFLDEMKLTWARFDGELGYTLGNSMQHDGLDGCWTISTADGNGARTAHNYADRPCRINTYGNSFTQCHQAGDGETWQEYLAGHFGEPVRNFGMGGYGVYQAYRRMVRTEKSELGGKYVLFYIWGDDHNRSLMRCRHAAIYPWFNANAGRPFHANFWAHVEMDLATGQFVEHDSQLPTPESLYRMTDPEFMFQSLRDDLMVQLYLLPTGQVDPASIDLAPLNRLADRLQVEGIGGLGQDELQVSATRLRNAYGFAATKFILDKTAAFCREQGRELMILLLCPSATWNLLFDEPRYDQEIADYVAEAGLPLFDMNLVHRQDRQCFNLSHEEYMKRYYIGHYSPAGNHFFAYSLKNKLVDWLDPKPLTYRGEESQRIDFEGYLPNATKIS